MKHHYGFWSLGSYPLLPSELEYCRELANEDRNGCEIIEPHMHFGVRVGYFEHSVLCGEPMERDEHDWEKGVMCQQLLNHTGPHDKRWWQTTNPELMCPDPRQNWERQPLQSTVRKKAKWRRKQNGEESDHSPHPRGP